MDTEQPGDCSTYTNMDVGETWQDCACDSCVAHYAINGNNRRLQEAARFAGLLFTTRPPSTIPDRVEKWFNDMKPAMDALRTAVADVGLPRGEEEEEEVAAQVLKEVPMRPPINDWGFDKSLKRRLT